MLCRGEGGRIAHPNTRARAPEGWGSPHHLDLQCPKFNKEFGWFASGPFGPPSAVPFSLEACLDRLWVPEGLWLATWCSCSKAGAGGRKHQRNFLI